MTLSVGDKVRVRIGEGAIYEGVSGVVEDLLKHRPLWRVVVRFSPTLRLCYAERELEVVALDETRAL